MLRNLTVAAILMLLTGIQAQHRVIFSSKRVCAVTGCAVKIACRFITPNHSSVTQREWHRLIQSSAEEPRVLDTDPEYTGRVSVSGEASDCELTLSNASVRDSGYYNFRFKTRRSDWISGSSRVLLTVTDLQVKVVPETTGNKEVKLLCSSACPLSTSLFYWYRNGQPKLNTSNSAVVLNSMRPSYGGSYSCGVHESSHRSPPVCVLSKECWNVSYPLDHVCVLKGTAIDLTCSYKQPADHTVRKWVWFIKQQTDGEPVDVGDVEEYQGRVHYPPDACSVRIDNLRETDTQTYTPRLYSASAHYTADHGVSLSVTGLRVTVAWTTTDTLTLSCMTTCSLSNNPAFVWYKNGRRVADCESASCSVAAVSGAVSYSCAVDGHAGLRSPPAYSPRNTKAVDLSSGVPVEGNTVTLSCRSDAKPPVHTYSWFIRRESADTLLTTGQNYSISNISSQHSGLYYCTATNQLGRHNSTPVRLDVSADVWMLHAVWGAAVPALLLSLLGAALCIRRKRGAKSNAGSQCITMPENDIYTELNPISMCPDYDSLQNVSDSGNDSYTPMKPVMHCKLAQ